MSTDLSLTAALHEADFQRLGLRRQECRLEVIRRAAAGRAAALVQKQRRSPSPRDQEQLSRLAVSTYRLLDPRQREQVSQRVHIGRILRPEQLDEQTPRFAPQPEAYEMPRSLEPAGAAAAAVDRGRRRLGTLLSRLARLGLVLCHRLPRVRVQCHLLSAGLAPAASTIGGYHPERELASAAADGIGESKPRS